MNETEKERLIKKDIESIENRVRHAFNQGYEMGMKESRSEIPNTCKDAISRADAIHACLDGWNKGYKEILADIRALPSVTPQQSNAEIQKIQEMEQAEIQKAYELGKAEMQPCEDAISRQAVLEGLRSDRYDYAALDRYVKDMPSVTPQQKVGRWIPLEYDGYADGNPVWDYWECSECGWEHEGDEDTLTAYCPFCGAKMEVEE